MPGGTRAASIAAAVPTGCARTNSWYWSSDAEPPAYPYAGAVRDGGRGVCGRRCAPGGSGTRDSSSRASAAASARLPAGGPGMAEAGRVAGARRVAGRAGVAESRPGSRR